MKAKPSKQAAGEVLVAIDRELARFQVALAEAEQARATNGEPLAIRPAIHAALDRAEAAYRYAVHLDKVEGRQFRPVKAGSVRDVMFGLYGFAGFLWEAQNVSSFSLAFGLHALAQRANEARRRVSRAAR